MPLSAFFFRKEDSIRDGLGETIERFAVAGEGDAGMEILSDDAAQTEDAAAM